MPTLRRRLLFGLVTNQGLERQVRRVPALERRAWRAARRYVAGETRDQALEAVRRLGASGITASVDFFGELVSDPTAAERATADYVRLASAVAPVQDAWLAIDLSHIGLDVSVDFCRRQLATIVAALPVGRLIQVGAEDSSRTDAVLTVVTALAGEGAPLMATLQANLRRSPQDIVRLAEAGLPVRLVKGAYVEPPQVAHPWGEETDVAFLRLAHQLRAAGVAFSLATHDPALREALLLALGPLPIEMLLGVREADARGLVRRGLAVRCYVPYGQDWFRYWMRRLAESQGTG
ncbi:MAG TPA: proline dehydrogenase family protein [Actinomycetes bacterium]|nr:proline dehydrogenase family protein [Actinomycetes bacterium]